MEGEGLFDDIKKGYNRKVKNSDLGKALRESAGMAIGDVYDKGAKKIGKNKYGKPISQHMRDKRGSNVKKLTEYTGLGLRVAGDGFKKGSQKFKADFGTSEDRRRIRTAVVRPDMDEMKKYTTKHGKGLRMSGDGLRVSGGMCQGCGMMNDKFIFADQAL